MKTFNFIPASQFSDKGNYRYEVTLSKNHTLHFSREILEVYNLSGHVLKFYLDPDNNTIGWCVMRSGKLDDFAKQRGTGVKRINVNKKSGNGVVDISLELRKMKLNLEAIATKKHSVQSFGLKGLLEEDAVVDYIELDEYAK